MESELSQLMDLAIDRGIKHSVLSSSIEDAVLQEYSARYPRGLRATSVLVDERHGTVHLLSGSTDVTPKEFVVDAARIARQTVLTLISPGHSYSAGFPALHHHGIHVSLMTLGGWMMRLMFWGYNSLYVFGLILFILGTVTTSFRGHLGETIRAIGIHRLLLFLVAGLSPLAAMFIAVRRRIATDPQKLAALFFLFELPMVLGAIVMTNVIWAPDRVMSLIILVFLMIPLVILSHILGIQPRRLRWQLALYTCQTWAFLGVIYVVLLVSFFVPPVIGYFFPSLGDIFGGMFYSIGDVWSETSRSSWSLGSILFVPIYLGFLLIWGLVLLFILIFPFVVPGVFALIFWRGTVTLRQRLGSSFTYRYGAVSAFLLLLCLLAVSYQRPVTPYLTSLSQLKSASTFEDRQEIARDLLTKERAIKTALTDMYSASSRYLWTQDDTTIARAYEDAFDLNQPTSMFIQQTFLTLAFPFVYSGPTDTVKAAESFQYLFGHPITEAKPSPTPTPPVQIVNRTIRATTKEEGLFATISIDETYENTTFQQQEVVYEFSLPETAVMTDLRLGPSLEFSGIIAPKGAAQRTYERELTRRRDPALLEQVGPRQYRLRVFPIPAKGDRTTLAGKNQRVEFTYIVAAEPEGYALPRYTLRRNIKEEPQTTATFFQGTPVSLRPSESFLHDPTKPRTSDILCNLPGTIQIQPFSASYSATIHLNDPSLIPQHTPCASAADQLISKTLDNYRIAILYDSSYDQTSSQFLQKMRAAFTRQEDVLKKNVIDFYAFNDLLSQPTRLTPDILKENIDVAHFGSSDLLGVLRSLRQSYDAIIIATGDHVSSAADNSLALSGTVPIYLIHTSDIPPYPENFHRHLVKSGGKVVESLPEALNHFALRRYFTKSQPVSNGYREYVYVGPYWHLVIERTVNNPLLPPPQISDPMFTFSTDPLTIFANKSVWQDYFLQRADGTFKEHTLPVLDVAHAFAKRTHLVTPYSSLLALVNDQQRQMLEQESQQYDRYEESQNTGSLQLGSIESPLMRSALPGGGIMSPWLGMDITNLELPDPASERSMSPGIGGIGSDGMSLGMPASSYTRITSLPRLLPSLFILVNVLIFGVGGSAYAISSFLRWRSHHKK